MSLATVTFTTDTVERKSGEKNGKPWEITEQAATLETAEMRVPVKIGLRKGQPAYKVGRYVMDVVKHLRVSDFGSVQLARYFDLQPAPASK